MPGWANRHMVLRRAKPRWQVRLARALAYGPALAGASAMALVWAPGPARAADAAGRAGVVGTVTVGARTAGAQGTAGGW